MAWSMWMVKITVNLCTTIWWIGHLSLPLASKILVLSTHDSPEFSMIIASKLKINRVVSTTILSQGIHPKPLLLAKYRRRMTHKRCKSLISKHIGHHLAIISSIRAQMPQSRTILDSKKTLEVDFSRPLSHMTVLKLHTCSILSLNTS